MSKKSTPFSEQWLLDRGYTKGENNTYVPPVKNVSSKVIGKLTPKQPVVNTPDFVITSPLESFLTIPGLVAGLNGSKGLMRGHWSAIKKQKELYQQIAKDQLKEGKIRRHLGQVKVTYVGYKSCLMDWDNFCASFKHIGDALVKEKILVEDNPKIIQEFLPKQIKCKRVDQKVIVIIEDI